jgi:Mrp family chromosome partitioning ATPase
MVVRLGSTTIDSITRAIQSLCQNNILGIVVNCAQKSELYHKYTYYHSYYYSRPEGAPEEQEAEATAEESAASQASAVAPAPEGAAPGETPEAREPRPE